MSSVIICGFSEGLDDMKRADQSDPLKVLRVLKQAGRFSAFEASANMTIARMMTRLYHKGLTYKGVNYGGPMLVHDKSTGYPWTKVIFSDSAERLLADHPEVA